MSFSVFQDEIFRATIQRQISYSVTKQIENYPKYTHIVTVYKRDWYSKKKK